MHGGVPLNSVVLLIFIIKRKRAKKFEENIQEYPSIKQYILEASKKGYPEEVIKKALIKKRWPEEVIDEYFKQIDAFRYLQT